MQMLDIAKEMLQREQLFHPSSTIIVAVSGGVDSMALLHALVQISNDLQLRLIAAHVNHGFRVQESAQEAELVRAYCNNKGITFEMTELDMPSYLEQNIENSQAASRQRRYHFLHEVAKQYEAKYIALAHHSDDQAETVLMHLLRGTGLTGLSGMQMKRTEKNVELIRPLLRMRKNQLKMLCEQEEVPFLDDSSNQSRDYVRNELRLDVIPLLEQYNPQLISSLNRLAEIAGEEDSCLTEQTKQIYEQIVKEQLDGYIVSCNSLSSLPIALQRRLIKLILSYLSQDATILSFEGIERIRAVASEHTKTTHRIDVGEGIICVREYEVLRFVHINHDHLSKTTPKPLSISLEHLPYTLQYGEWVVTFSMIPSNVIPQLHSRYEVIFDVAQLSLPLQIRTRIAGDRMHVLGLNGTKKVQDLFVDAKIAALDREKYPILVDEHGQVLWLPGIRRSRHALVDEQSSSILYIQCIRRNHHMLDR